MAENVLYVGEIGVKPDNRQGIAVYNVSDPKDPKEVGFVKTSRAPYHLFSVPGKRLLASLGADSNFHFVTGQNIQVHGNSAIFSVANPTQPSLGGEVPKSGGRSATTIAINGEAYLVCNGVVFRVTDNNLERVFSFFPGRILDGCPYHGDSDGEYAAVASDSEVCVVRSRKLEPKSEKVPGFSEHLIKKDYSYSYGLDAADLDGDGDLDVTSCDTRNFKLYWFENSGQGKFKEHLIEDGDRLGILGIITGDAITKSVQGDATNNRWFLTPRLERHMVGDVARPNALAASSVEKVEQAALAWKQEQLGWKVLKKLLAENEGW